MKQVPVPLIFQYHTRLMDQLKKIWRKMFVVNLTQAQRGIILLK